MKVADAARMAVIDRQSQARFAIPQGILMEDAALRAYQLLKERIWGGRLPPGRITFLVGKGNNGGDALVMARQCRLEGKRELTIVLGAGNPAPGSLAEANLKPCAALQLEILSYPEQGQLVEERLREALWLIDGLLGTGLAGAAKPPLAELIRLANECPAAAVAIDIPSGIGDGYREGFPAVRVEYTLTIGLPKTCLFLPRARSLCGEILVVRGVFPSELIESPDIPGSLLDEADLSALLPALPPDTHKGRRGHLAVFAGSEGTTGAAWLSCTAAARSRTGLVTLFIDRDLYAANLPKFSSVMIRPWESSAAAESLDLRRFSALLVGPGWGLHPERLSWLEHFISLELPCVLDADGITLLAELSRRRPVKLHGRWVLTPHPGEFARLAGVEAQAVLDDPLPRLLEASAALEAVVVLKGHCTFIGAPEGRYWILDGMNPAMATGGSGDVLAGMISGLAAGGISILDAARLGVFLHSQIGQRAYRERGYFLAEDLLPYVSSVMGGL